MNKFLKYIEIKFKSVFGTIFGHLYIEHLLSKHVPVFIYQMGKVGSQSIVKTLKNSYPGVVVSGHRLRLDHHKWKLKHIYDHIVVNERPINVISIVREPVGRNVSAFFENFKRDIGIAFRKSRFTLDELKHKFLNNYQHQIPLEWFDVEIRENLGIDVYVTPFPENGWCVYEKDHIRLLVLKLEIDDRLKIHAIEEFLGLRGLKMLYDNVGRKKDYAETYLEFQSQVKLPFDYLNTLCNSKYFRHFYDQETFDSIKLKWGKSQS